MKTTMAVLNQYQQIRHHHAGKHFHKKYFLTLLLCFASAGLYANTCKFTATPMDFGIYYPMQKNRLDITGALEIDCRGRRGVYQVSASAGQSGNFQDRHLNNGSNILRYNLFTNASRTLIWGDGTGNTTIFSGYHPGGRTREVLNIHGYILSSQDANPGIYTDFITVTAEF